MCEECDEKDFEGARERYIYVRCRLPRVALVKHMGYHKIDDGALKTHESAFVIDLSGETPRLGQFAGDDLPPEYFFNAFSKKEVPNALDILDKTVSSLPEPYRSRLFVFECDLIARALKGS
jgi:hypothetical protein